MGKVPLAPKFSIGLSKFCVSKFAEKFFPSHCVNFGKLFKDAIGRRSRRNNTLAIWLVKISGDVKGAF
jgi:hypothetical protein